MNLDKRINSSQYDCKLSEHLSQLLRAAKSTRSESDVASMFENEIYYFIRSYFGIHINFSKEVGQLALRHKFSGRMDALCNNLVIEYKKQGKLDKEKDVADATKQISDYLQQLLEESGNEYYGLLTDGIKIKYIYFVDSVLHSTPIKNIEEEDLDKLIRSLVDIENKKFIPLNLVADFKLNSTNSITQDLAKYLYSKLCMNFSGKTYMLFQEWKTLFHLSENDKGQNDDIIKRRRSLSKIFGMRITDNDDDYKALFALQTTYAILVKLIACKIVARLEYNEEIEYFSDLTDVDPDALREFLEYVEDGYVFQTGGVKNLLEGDFFSWYCSEDVWSDAESSILLRVINTLEGYSHSFYIHGHTTKDIFIDLYMEIIPPEVRHSLGEYFTPAWLADYVVSKGIKTLENSQTYSAIDPCCGSGVFIMALIKNMIGTVDTNSLSNTAKKNLLHSIVNRVKGVDINPLSVLTAKVSFYIAIKPLLNGDDIEIPIYLGDSANIPKNTIVDNVECYQYEIKTKQEDIDVLLPKSFVEQQGFFNQMSQIQTFIKAEDPKLVYEKFITNIGDDELNTKIKKKIKDLSKQLIELHKKEWDGIWIRIVANFMLVARIKNIDLIVGNPPWVKWEFLPQEYAEKIKSLCLERHLFSGQSYMGAISLNICALIANVTASTWLSKNGTLAFLMPQTLMTQDSYAGFRNFFIDYSTNERMYLQRLDDWTKSGNPFVDTTEKFMTYYYKRNAVDYFKDGIPIDIIKKKRGYTIADINFKQTYCEVQDMFEISSAMAYQLDKKRTGYSTINKIEKDLKKSFDLIVGKCDYKARSGVEFTPAEIYFIEPLRESKQTGNYVFKNSSFKNAKHKNTNNLPIELETKYIRPVIKAPAIEPFGFKNSNNYCIFPYEEGITQSINTSDMAIGAPNLLKYFLSRKRLIEKQSQKSKAIARGTAFYSLSKVGNYTFSKHKVTFRDNTKLSAAVVQKIKTPWGQEIEPVCAKHCPYISQDNTGRAISESEAYYICGILNSSIVQKYFQATFSTRSYSINFNINIPLYNSKNKHHKKIMQLAKKATENGISDNTYKLLDKYYILLCEELSNNKPNEMDIVT